MTGDFIADFIISAFICCVTYGISYFILRFFLKSEKSYYIALIVIGFLNLILYYTIFKAGFSWGFVVADIISFMLTYFIAAVNSVICPECGAWNAYEEIEVIDSSVSEVWETHYRDIRDNRGNKLGTYENRELHSYRDTQERLKCTKCGNIFEWTFRKEI